MGLLMALANVGLYGLFFFFLAFGLIDSLEASAAAAL